MTTAVETRPRTTWQVLDLGLESFARTLSRQEELVRRRLTGSVPDTLILVEHPPVVTLGRAKSRENLRLTPEELRGRVISKNSIPRPDRKSVV